MCLALLLQAQCHHEELSLRPARPGQGESISVAGSCTALHQPKTAATQGPDKNMISML